MIGITPQHTAFRDMLKRHAAANVVTLSFQEMADIFGVKSKTTVLRLLDELERHSLIRSVLNNDGRRRKRYIQIAGKNLCPHCGNIFDSAACRAAAANKVSYSFSPVLKAGEKPPGGNTSPAPARGRISNSART